MLTNRQELVLMSIVDNFLDHMTPLSSNYLLETYNLNVSPATIRNEMSKLESLGLLKKPHTSAGRIPTRQAIRYYVSKLNQDLALQKTPLTFSPDDSDEGCYQTHLQTSDTSMNALKP